MWKRCSVNRVNGAEAYWVDPVDVCYQLVAVMRTRWKGFAGGSDVWNALTSFFDALRERCVVVNRGSAAESAGR